MWLPVGFLIFAGIVTADYEHGWKIGNEYTYVVRSRTLASLNQISDQSAGFFTKAVLTLQAKDSNTLSAKISNCEYAQIHKSLPNGLDTEISDQLLELESLPASGKPFEVKLKHGVIRDVMVDRDVPTWEVNMLKSMISQLQVDTQGENAIENNQIQIPSDEEPYASFRAMEDSVGGKCEVLYDMTPLADHMLHTNPELVPLPELKEDGHYIDITKTKNFDNCEQRMNYHFGITGSTNWEPGSNDNGEFLSKSATSRIVISGNLKSFTIQSSVTTSKMFISPRFFDEQNGIVACRMNVTLRKVEEVSSPFPSLSNPESTGNLVYTFNDPFSDMENRRTSKKRESYQSNQRSSSDSISSVSSSEEVARFQQDFHKFSSSSSSSSSSSISSSEENDFWQPKPTLTDAPHNPFLPNFIGYKGKFIGKSDEVDVTEASNDLLSQISNELDDPSNIPEQQTLEKFTILCSVFRTMSRKQIEQVENNVHLSSNDLKSHDPSKTSKQNRWSVFRDAIIQAGTGPALLTIKDWIERRNVGSFEMADAFSRLPKTARTPTTQYVKVLFEIVTNPNVVNDPIVHPSAMMAFADLVRQSQVSGKSIHNYYPVHTFGRLSSKHDRSVQDEYIPYLARELTKAFKDNDSTKIQTYVMALGGIGHPKILSVFEPYLEGTESATIFQRTFMVASLGKLSEMVPRLARSILYKIYLNTMESQEVRCTAVFLLMKTNPPLSMLQRMAEFTNYDTSKHVNSAVKSTLTNLAGLSSPEYRELAKKCRTAIGLLTPHDYSYQFSHGFYSDGTYGDKNVVSQIIANYIGSDDSFVPRALYFGWFSSYGDFKTPPTEFLSMMSTIRPLVDMVFKDYKKDGGQSIKWVADQIAEQLSIVPEESIPFEGHFWWNTKFLSKFIPFDRHSLHRVSRLIAEHLMSAKDKSYLNTNKLASYDVTLGFPTETGFPFVYTFRIPILYKISGTGQWEMSSGPSVNVQSSLRLLYSQKIEGRIGFVVPFGHRHFAAGVDVNFQAYVPIKFSLEASMPDGNFQLKVWPLKGEEKSKLLHYSVIPYTSNHDIFSLQPFKADKNTHRVYSDSVRKFPIPLPDSTLIRFEIEADKSDEEFWNIGVNTLHETFSSPWTMDYDKYRKIEISLNLKREWDEPVTFKASYNSSSTAPEDYVPEDWASEAKAVEPSSKELNSENRMRQYMAETAKGIKSATSHVINVHVEFPTEPKTISGITFAFSSSDVEQKTRSLFYWNFHMPCLFLQYEVCAASQTNSIHTDPLFFDEAMRFRPSGEFDVDVRYGETCSQGERLNVKGKAEQSAELREKVMGTSMAKACLEEMKHGNKILKSCRNAVALATTFDQLEMSMGVAPDNLVYFINKGLGNVGIVDYADVRVDTSNPKNAGKNTIDVRSKFDKDLDTADFSVHTPTMDLYISDVNLETLGVAPVDTLDNAKDEPSLAYNEYERYCALDKTRVETFDGKEYPLRLGNCWHVVMTTYPKTNPNNQDEKLEVPEDSRVNILSREAFDGSKEFKILFGQDEIRFSPSDDEPKVFVNGKSISTNYQKRDDDDDVAFEIYRYEDSSVGLTSDKYDVHIIYDGHRMLIKASDKYHSSIRGLCGNFDGHASNDFVGPKNCVLQKPEEFTASYALTKDECEGVSFETAKSLESFDCVPYTNRRHSDVINEGESGRSKVDRRHWGYHREGKAEDKRCSTHRTKIFETNSKICFTTRPVFSCAPGCSATERKTKSYPFYCMERNEAAISMKKRIEKGANPDLSQKPVDMTRSIGVPLACKA